MARRPIPSRPSALQRELGKRSPFASRPQEAYLSIQRTAALLGAEFQKILRAHDLSEATYNVLRILRGALDDGGSRTCSEIGEHMVTPVPDVTRLVDRLERRSLVRRTRNAEDRRVVRVSITKTGLDALAALDRPIIDAHERQLSHMSPADLNRLITLLDQVRKRIAIHATRPSSRA